MFFELRQYRIRPGKKESWVKFMDEMVIPFQISKGMVVPASFVTTEEEEDYYVWLRRFDSEEQRKKLYAAAYENEYWTEELLPVVLEHIFRDENKVTRIEPTPSSIIR